MHAEPKLQISAAYVQNLGRGPSFGADFVLRGKWVGYGLRTYITKGFFQIDGLFGAYIPIKAGKIAFTPFGNIGVGLQFEPGSGPILPDFGFSFQGGLQFTTAAVPGLYFQAAYQYNLFVFDTGSEKKSGKDNHMVFIGLGYAIK